MTDFMYEVPSDNSIQRITITAPFVRGEGEAIVERAKDLAG